MHRRSTTPRAVPEALLSRRSSTAARTAAAGAGAPRGTRTTLACLLLVLASLLCAGRVRAADEAPKRRITFRLADAAGRLVSDLETLQPVVRTVFDETGSKTVPIGDRATLWVRGASVDDQFGFEQYYQGKYINRRSELAVDFDQLKPGEHVINPGGHRFSIDAAGRVSSTDPEMTVDGDTVTLRMHKVTVLCVDGSQSGPPESRLIAMELGVLLPPEKGELKADSLPDPRKLPNMLSHARAFYPLEVYLPSNRVRQGYVLFPAWQTFHVTPGGTVELGAGGAPKVPGVEADGARIIVPCRRFSGQVSTRTNLQAGVGSVKLGRDMLFSPTIEPLRFRAGIGQPDEKFFLPVDSDFSRFPNKFFLADNTWQDPKAVRLLALEWDHPVLEAGAETSVRLRFLDTPDRPTVPEPVARVAWSPCSASDPAMRRWTDLGLGRWADGTLAFKAPIVPYGFYYIRASVLDAGEPRSVSALAGEFLVCIIPPGLKGTASVAANKGRTAFAAGETVRLHVILRSAEPRPAGRRTVVVKCPDGSTETASFDDPGTPWAARPFELPESVTAHLPIGRYEVSVDGLPPGVVSFPFSFDLASGIKTSPYLIIKPSKYTKAMNNLVPSHIPNGRLEPVDLQRAVDSLAELGYNRIDLMTYLTNHHFRTYTGRERLAASDPRLMAPDAVYTPSPRNQLLDACVRNNIEFSDVLLSYNDFVLPRYIDGYIEASRRWARREVASMRHSPAFAGLMLYDEMYDTGVSGLIEEQQNVFAKIRKDLARAALGEYPAKIQAGIARYMARPRKQRDPAALQDFLRLRRWEEHGWGDYNTRVAEAARSVLPTALIGTYHRTWMGVGSALGILNGWPPDVFEGLDLIGHVHYADNSTGWVHSSIMVPGLRSGPPRPIFINIPLTHEARGQWNGEYQRQMAFAMLMQGAGGVSQWGLPATFDDGPNPGMVEGKETTAQLNKAVLAPFGELATRTRPGYTDVGIVTTFNQHALSEFKQVAVSNMIEDLWIACWRLGYPATFLYDDAFDRPVTQYKIIFVPGVRFDGELDPQVVERLKEAVKAGSKVVVESGSVLDLPGLVRLDDLKLNTFFVRVYFPTWLDDELNKIFEKSQATTDYLAAKLPELGIRPAATGPFKVGPNWRTSGDINYLVMANFEDPDYSYQIKQIMAKPVLMPLTVAASRGRVAVDLLAGKPLALKAEQNGTTGLTVDLSRVQGALVAFLPEAVGRLDCTVRPSADGATLRIAAGLVGVSGKPIQGVFPARIELSGQAGAAQTFYRALGEDLAFDLPLPVCKDARTWTVRVRELIGGMTAQTAVAAPARQGAVVRVDGLGPLIPRPGEVAAFLKNNRQVTIVPAAGMAAVRPVADELAAALKARGIEARVADEMTAFRFPSGVADQLDPMNDGFHSWRKGSEVVQPATVVDAPVILLGARSGSYLLDGLINNGFVSEAPIGVAGEPSRPSIQVAPTGLHWKYDTLCLIANDAADMKRCVEALLGPAAEAQARPAAAWGAPKAFSGATAAAAIPAASVAQGNEKVMDIEFDQAGNPYVITWGHGDNLYALDPSGRVRFTRQLPEMGALRLDVYADRLLAFTSAGSRLYQLSLDGKPLSQIRLTLDPGPVGDEGYDLSQVTYRYLPRLDRLVLQGQPMKILGADGRPVAEWSGEAYADKDVSDHVMHRTPRQFVLSPDGTRIAQIETSSYFTRDGHKDREVVDSHLVVRDINGKLLHEFKNVANEYENPTAVLRWLADAPGPSVIVKGELWQFDDKLSLLFTRGSEPGVFSDAARRLVADGRALRCLRPDDSEVCRLGPFETMPTTAAFSPDGAKAAFLDEYGLLTVWDLAKGTRLSGFTVEQQGTVLRFTPASDGLVVGGLRGLVQAYRLAGDPLWRTDLAQHNGSLLDPKLYDASFKDLTDNLWPVRRDEPGELDALVRMGKNRLANPDAEEEGGWEGQGVRYAAPGFSGARSLRVGNETVSQQVTKYLGHHVTWVLEFQYRAAPGAGTPELLAGVRVDNEYPDTVARRLAAGEDWRFARVVVKSGKNCRSMRVGFSASGGDVLVDNVLFRQIRFPSINHMLYEPFYDVTPVILTNGLFSESYDPIGNLRVDAPNVVTVPPYNTGGKPLVEPAFLQNGRANDIGSLWYEMPPNRFEGSDLNVSMTLREPRWVSMVALYFNVYDEQNVTRHFDLFVTDVDQKRDVLVASVRNNTQLFRLIKFPPLRATQVRLVLVHSIRRLRTVTEMELYGPLSGREVAAGVEDPDAQYTYMGSFARVDKREKALLPQYGPLVWRRGTHQDPFGWSVPRGQILVSNDEFYVSRTLGFSERYALSSPASPVTSERAGCLGFSPFATLYGGLILKGGEDGNLYCIDAQSSRRLWAVPIGRRVRCCAAVIDEDVFVTSDRGRLYKIDLANGSVLMDVEHTGTAWGSVATDGKLVYFVTDNGLLRAVDAETGLQRWQAAVAPETVSTPAVDAGVVYVGDAKGDIQAVAASDGRSLWRTPLGQEFTRCPVVTADKILVGCRDGLLACLARADGRTLWTQQTHGRFDYEPVVLADQVLFFDGNQARLAALDSGAVKEFQVPVQVGREIKAQPFAISDDPMAPISYYKGALFVVPRAGDLGHTVQYMNYGWHLVGGAFYVVPPPPPAAPEPKKNAR